MFRKKRKDLFQSPQAKLVAHTQPKSPISEQYRTIRTNIQFSSVDVDVRSLVVTSSAPGEGKSTTTANLAVVMAQQGKKVLIVDADMRKPTVHYTFRRENHIGLTTVLTRQSDLRSAIQTTEVENLYVLTSGPIPPNPAELLDSFVMKETLGEMMENFDFVLFDTPPILAVTDAQIMANFCHASILVIHAGKTETEAAQKAKALLEGAKGKLLGAVLNQKKQTQDDYYYYYGAR